MHFTTKVGGMPLKWDFSADGSFHAVEVIPKSLPEQPTLIYEKQGHCSPFDPRNLKLLFDPVQEELTEICLTQERMDIPPAPVYASVEIKAPAKGKLLANFVLFGAAVGPEIIKVGTYGFVHIPEVVFLHEFSALFDLADAHGIFISHNGGTPKELPNKKIPNAGFIKGLTKYLDAAFSDWFICRDSSIQRKLQMALKYPGLMGTELFYGYSDLESGSNYLNEAGKTPAEVLGVHEELIPCMKHIKSLDIPAYRDFCAARLHDYASLCSLFQKVIDPDRYADMFLPFVHYVLKESPDQAKLGKWLNAHKTIPGPSTGKVYIRGKTIVITGTLSTTRDIATEKLRDAGALVVPSVNRHTDYLLVGEKPGKTKMNKAKELGIPTIQETQLPFYF